jgi:hypothetical protein
MSRQVGAAAITQAGIPRVPPAGRASASTLATVSGSPVRRRSAGTRWRPIQAGAATQRLASSVGYLPGPAAAGEGLADPLVRVVAAGLEGLDHSRDPGRGRAVREGVDHIAADQGIGILDQLEQPRPHPVVVGLDVAGAQVLARELASPALLAPGERSRSPSRASPGCAPVADRQTDPYLPGDLVEPSHHLDDIAGRDYLADSRSLRTLNSTGSLEVASQIGRAAGGPLKRLTQEHDGKPEPAGRRNRTCVCALVNPALKAATACGDCPPTNARSHQNIHLLVQLVSELAHVAHRVERARVTCAAHVQPVASQTRC